MEYTKEQQLIDRITNNYMDFKASLRGVSRDALFTMAGRISAVTEVYEVLTTYYEWDENGKDEVDFYLLFRDPLTIIADAWEYHRNNMAVDLTVGQFELPDNDTVISQYPLMEGVADDIIYIGDTEHKMRIYGEI